MKSISLLQSAVPLLLAASVVGVVVHSTGPLKAAGTCPAGYRLGGDEPGEAGACVPMRHPESYFEKAQGAAQWQDKFGAPPPGAIRAAVERKAAMQPLTASLANAGGTWQQYGTGPLIANDANYPNVNGEGLVTLSGRVDSFAYDSVSKRVFALPGNGGLWMSSDWTSANGPTWIPIGDQLPTTNNGSVAWTTAGGGTLVVLSGNSDFLGSPSYGGLGAYWSTDLGQTWNHASGIPDSLFGFELAVDHSNPSVIYAATSRGLYRSSDGGHSFTDVALPTYVLDPTGKKISCAGVETLGQCQFATVVTSVVVQEPGGATKLGVDRFHLPVAAVIVLLVFESLIGTRRNLRQNTG